MTKGIFGCKSRKSAHVATHGDKQCRIESFLPDDVVLWKASIIRW